MAQVRLPLVGTGIPTDPLRVELPAYRTVWSDVRARVAVVEVADADLPPDPAARRDLEHRGGPHDSRPMWPLQRSLDAWHRHLDERYRKHRGRYRPIPI